MSLFVLPAVRATDANNLILSGAKLAFYISGGTTPAAVYTTSALDVPHTNPVVADAGGLFAPIYLSRSVIYRAVLKTAAGATIADIDPISDPLADLFASGGASLVGFLPSGAGAVARTVQDRLRDTVSIKDFGAVGDGVTDDRAAFVAASAARGKRIFLPKGNYLINSDGGSISLEEMDLVGENVLDGATGTIDQGAMLWIKGTTNSPFLIRRGVSFEGVGFYYPDQPDSASPVAYPSTLKFDFANGAVQFVSVRRCVVYNAYKFLEIDNGMSGGIGHIDISDNFICALNRAIYLRYNAEHFRIERNNFTFGHWLAATEAGAAGYMRANATAFQVDQTDGVEFSDNLVFGYKNGVLAAALGLCQFVKITDNKIDQVRYGVRAVGSGNFGGQISANTFNAFNSQDHTLQGRSISIETTGTGTENITVCGNEFACATEEHLYTTGNAATRKIVCGVNNYRSWAAFKTSGTYGAINANGSLTNVQVSGGHFYGGNSVSGGNHSYGITGTFNTLVCSGASFDTCQRPVSVVLTAISGAGNVSFSTADTVSDSYTATTKNWGPNGFDKPQDKTPLTITLAAIGTYANDAAAAAAGVPVGGLYRNASALQIRAA
jgi:hypothetical protein